MLDDDIDKLIEDEAKVFARFAKAWEEHSDGSLKCHTINPALDIVRNSNCFQPAMHTPSTTYGASCSTLDDAKIEAWCIFHSYKLRARLRPETASGGTASNRPL